MSKWRFWRSWFQGRDTRAKRLLEQGAAAYVDGQFTLAAKKWEAASQLLRASGQHPLLAACENSLGNVYKMLGHSLRALQTYERAQALHQSLGDQLGEAADWANAGTVYQDLGDLDRAEELIRRALTVYQTLGRRASVANQLGNLGNLKLMRGDLTAALTAYKQSTAIHHEVGDRVGEATGLASQANILRLVGDFTGAQAVQEEALSLTREIGDRHGEAESLGALGLIYQNQGNLTNALQHYTLALALRRRMGDRLGAIRDLTNLGNVHRICHRLDQAIRCAEEALKIARASGYQRDQAIALAALGLAYQRKGDLPLAQTFQTQAMELAQALADPEILWRLYGGRGDTHRLLGRLDSAYDDYRASIAQIEAVRGRLAVQRDRLGYLSEERLADYKRLVSLLADRQGLYRPAESLEYAERARGRTFLDLLEQTTLPFPLEEGKGGAVPEYANPRQSQPQTFEAIQILLT